MGNIGLPELIVLLVIILVLFGARKLPDLARSLGRSIGEFKKGREEGEQEAKKTDHPSDKSSESGNDKK